MKTTDIHRHGQNTKTVHETNYSGLEPGVRELVAYFNAKGLRTSMSCDGSDGHGFGFLWVEFHKSVTQSDIQDFMARHTKDGTEYCGHGWFGIRLSTDKTEADCQNRYYLVYMASDAEAAGKDLAKWQTDDKTAL